MADLDFMRFVDELQGQIDKLKKMIKSAGGGSTVTITPTLESGVKLADFTIGEDSGVIYAPSNAIVYSSDEVEIGTWIDGKPLYRKVISADNITADAYSSDLVSGVDFFATEFILCVDSTASTSNSPGVVSTYNIAGVGTDYAAVNKSADNGLRFVNLNRVNTINAIASVIYTKVTTPETRTKKKK